MKNILLTTTALVAFAGAAAAEVSFSGSATLGYNDYTVPTGATDTAGQGDNDGFYWDANVAVSLSQELDNGLTAGASFDFDVADNSVTNGADGVELIAGGYLLSLTSEAASLYFGQTDFAAQTLWASAGDMQADGFSEADGETVLRGDVTMAGIEASLSYGIADVDDVSATDSVNQLSLAAKGSFGNFTVVGAYQEEANDDWFASNPDFTNAEIFGLSASTTFSGATVTAAYASKSAYMGDAAETSTGIKVAYPFGPVTATAYYVMEDVDGVSETDDNYGVNVAYASGAVAVTLDYQNDQTVSKTALDGSYDLGNGLVVYAGMYMEDDKADEYYVAGAYDLGGGASVLVSYADGANNTDDEIGANDYQNGTTVEVAFTF